MRAAGVLLLASVVFADTGAAIDRGEVHGAALRTALAHADPAVRWRAAWAIARTPDPAAGDVLVGLLGDADPSVRFAAQVALSRMPAHPALAAMLADREVPAEHRLSAVRALARTGSPDAVKPLRRALARAPRKMRPDFVRALGHLGPPAIPLLLKELRRAELHTAVADALYRIGPAAQQALEGSLSKGSRIEQNGRWIAWRRFAAAGARSGPPGNPVKELAEALASLERQRQPPGQLPDIRLLPKYTVPQAIALAERAEGDRAIELFVRMLGDPNPRVVEAGVRGVGRLPFKGAFRRVLDLARGPNAPHDRDLRLLEVAREGKVRGAAWTDRELDKVMRAIRRDFRSVEVAAIWALARFGFDLPEVRAVLRAATEADDARVRRSAFAALWVFGEKPETARDSVRAALRDPTWAWRIEEFAPTFGPRFTDALLVYPKAIAALGEATLPRLVDHLYHDRHTAEVLAALAEMGPAGAGAGGADAVLATALDPRYERRAHAVLAAMGEAARPALRARLTDEDVRIRYHAARALGAL